MTDGELPKEALTVNRETGEPKPEDTPPMRGLEVILKNTTGVLHWKPPADPTDGNEDFEPTNPHD